jgi:PKD repeat protein
VQIVLNNPAAFPASITVNGPIELCETDQATLTASSAASYLWSNGATTPSITVDKAGTYTVTLTSALGCISTATQIITSRICNVPPVAVCKEVVVLVAKDNCYATLRTEDIDAGSYDDNGDWFNRSFDIQPDLKVGTYYVNFTVQDTYGTTGSCITRVDVLDHSAPVALTKNITLRLSEGGSITPQMIDNGSHDGCGSVQLSLSQSEFDCSHLGDNQVILIVTDAAGNKATEIATVTVIDDLNPELVQNTITVALDKDGKAEITEDLVKRIARDNCAVWEVQMDRTAFNCENIGENHVNITLIDVYGNRTSAVLTVLIKDTLAPVLAGSELTLYLDQKGQARLQDFRLQDNCSSATLEAEKDQFSCEDLGTHLLRVTATDTYGNSSTDTLIVHVRDTLAPTLKTKTPLLALDASGNATLSAEQVDNGSTDNCGILSRTLSKTSFNCSEVGVHSVLYTITDAAGNTVSDTVQIQVVDQTPPTVRTQTVVLELSSGGTATLNVEDVNEGSTDNCSLASMNLSQTTFSCTDLGTRTVVLTVVDVNGNSASAQAEIIIRDPDAICPCSFGIIADAEINLKDNAVMAGGLGVISGKVVLRNTLLDEEGTFAKANQKDFDDASSATKFIQGSAPTIPARITNPDRKKGSKKISGEEELKAGKYGKLVLKKGAELSLSGDVYVRRLVVRKNAKVLFSAPGRIIARDRAKFAKNTELSGVGAKLYTARATKISEGALIKAHVQVGSLLQVKGARMEGFFAAHTVRGSKNATWSGGGVLCRENETSALSKEEAKSRTAIITADTLAIQAEISLKVSPNPAAESVLVKLYAPSGKGQLSLHSLTGRTLATVSVNAMDFQHRFDLKQVLPGTYIIRYQDGSSSKTLRLVKEDF